MPDRARSDAVTSVEQEGAGAARRPTGSAARLLDVIARESPETMQVIADRLGADPSQLDECRRGVRALSARSQMQLAACVVDVAPRFARPAHRLFAQAQAALRMESSADERHLTYPRERFR